MLDEFPALGRLDFFESSLAFMAGYGIRAFVVAQSLHQIDRAYGYNHAILDNCHVRVAFAPNDERTAKRLSDALGTATQLKRQTNLSGKRLSAWLSHTSISEQETSRPLLTPGEILQLPSDDALVLVSSVPPIRASKLKYYADRNFRERRLPAPQLRSCSFAGALPPRPDDWLGQTCGVHEHLEKAWSEMVSNTTAGRSPETEQQLDLRGGLEQRDLRSRSRSDSLPDRDVGPDPSDEDDEIPR
jgi:type IV secretion system protein VirD4